MAHYAFLDDNNVVIEVITGKNENEDGIDWEQWYGNFRGKKCKRTSYNTIANKHTQNGTPFRKNFASLNYVYDEMRDAFLPPKPFDSWILDEETCAWKAPKPQPNIYMNWDETIKEWI